MLKQVLRVAEELKKTEPIKGHASQ